MLKVKYILLLISDVLYMKTVNWEYTPWFALSLGLGNINKATLQFQTSGLVNCLRKVKWEYGNISVPLVLSRPTHSCYLRRMNGTLSTNSFVNI